MREVKIIVEFTTGTTSGEKEHAEEICKEMLLRELKTARIAEEQHNDTLFILRVLAVYSESL